MTLAVSGQWALGFELGDLLIAAVGVLLGSSLQGVIGFGFAFIAVPTLGLVMPDRLPQVVLLCAAPLVLAVAWHERRSVDFVGVGWTIAGRLLGVLPGLLILAWLTGPLLQAFTGAVVIVAAALMLYRAGAPVVAPNPAISMGAGVAAGVMATTVGMGGPPIALLYSRRPGSELRGTLATIFVVGNIASTGALTLAGYIKASDVVIAAALVVPLFVGLSISRLLLGRFPAMALTKPVLAVVLVMGLVLVVRGAF